jgi:hypothetical protein
MPEDLCCCRLMLFSCCLCRLFTIWLLQPLLLLLRLRLLLLMLLPPWPLPQRLLPLVPPVLIQALLLLLLLPLRKRPMRSMMLPQRLRLLLRHLRRSRLILRLRRRSRLSLLLLWLFLLPILPQLQRHQCSLLYQRLLRQRDCRPPP